MAIQPALFACLDSLGRVHLRVLSGLRAGSPRKTRRQGLHQRAHKLAEAELTRGHAPTDFEVAATLQEAEQQAQTLLQLSGEIQARCRGYERALAGLHRRPAKQASTRTSAA